MRQFLENLSIEKAAEFLEREAAKPRLPFAKSATGDWMSSLGDLVQKAKPEGAGSVSEWISKNPDWAAGVGGGGAGALLGAGSALSRNMSGDETDTKRSRIGRLLRSTLGGGLAGTAAGLGGRHAYKAYQALPRGPTKTEEVIKDVSKLSKPTVYELGGKAMTEGFDYLREGAPALTYGIPTAGALATAPLVQHGAQWLRDRRSTLDDLRAAMGTASSSSNDRLKALGEKFNLMKDPKQPKALFDIMSARDNVKADRVGGLASKLLRDPALPTPSWKGFARGGAGALEPILATPKFSLPRGEMRTLANEARLARLKNLAGDRMSLRAKLILGGVLGGSALATAGTTDMAMAWRNHLRNQEATAEKLAPYFPKPPEVK